MTSYVIIIAIAILIGMAISVSAFGTGGKRKKIFQDIYYSVEDVEGIGVIYTKTGDFSAVIEIENPVQKHSADIDSYYEFNRLFTAIALTLGEGYAMHKQDIFMRRKFQFEGDDSQQEYLSRCYFDYFRSREYTDARTFLTITQENKKNKLFAYDDKKWKDFMVKIRKAIDQFKDANVPARFLTKEEAREFVDRFFAMDFTSRVISMNNLKVDEEEIGMGDRHIKVYSLVDVDSINLPGNCFSMAQDYDRFLTLSDAWQMQESL